METILTVIQNKLKAPKNQFNSFGKYHYRSCEDILEALKPILLEYGAVLTISDSIENIGNRYYVKATATIGIKDAGQISVTAFAREEEDKKGMDGAQVTGAASSYSRKYALNGLFLIDDTKDADTRDNSKEGAKKEPEPETDTHTVNFIPSDVRKKIGKKKDGTEYTRYTVKGPDGEYNTFSEAVAKQASIAKDTGELIAVMYKSGKFGNDITLIAEPNYNEEMSDGTTDL
jgi:hypothetical protein